MSATAFAPVTPEQQAQYQEEGYFILEGAIPEDHLAMLRAECERAVAAINERMDREGVDVAGLNHRNSRYFISHPSLERPQLREFLYSELMAAICRATIGPTAYLYWEQYVVKAAESGMKFSWHQDSAYGNPVDHRPYVSCWCALDDMSEENGTVYLLPFSRAGRRNVGPHVRDEASNDLVGFHGDDPGIPIIVPAGSIAVFSSVTFHRSGANTTGGTRRVYLAQYSAEPILKKDGSGPWGFAEPVLLGGRPYGPA